MTISQSKIDNWIIRSILYSSYNSVLLIPILISVRNYIKQNKDIKYIAFIVFMITIILLSIIFFLLLNIKVDINKIEVPAVYAIDEIWHDMKGIYGIIILISIYTTAISLGMSFLKNVAKSKRMYNKVAIYICLTSAIFSIIGFSNLINLLYPILGVLGILQIIQIFIY